LNSSVLLTSKQQAKKQGEQAVLPARLLALLLLLA